MLNSRRIWSRIVYKIYMLVVNNQIPYNRLLVACITNKEMCYAISI